MIRILIIEDEIPARKKLRRFIEDLYGHCEITAEIDTIRKAVDFLNTNQVDLIFSDIELLDGNAFDIYRQVSVKCPIIFTTAYDQFLMDAFDTNGIAYLLKPFSQARFRQAWDKFLLLKNPASTNPILDQKTISELTRLLQLKFSYPTYKKRFTIHAHRGIYFVETIDVLFFEANEGVIFAHDKQGKTHLLNETTLKEIEEQLDPLEFFRINRSELVQKKYITKIERYTKNTLSIQLNGHENPLKTSQSQTAVFREWMEK